ncbi:LytR/AlgR family response regulator transcription factor [Polaribacter uvawellassae]|uniref:LytR/AlgR family response regulator transcription factor n=1 Tax=Polaribacter uvawellassae TaxID=3133495 RepID=UPI00321B7981
MNCILIDDEGTARMILNQLCLNVEDLNVVEEFSNAIEAIKYLNKNDIDLIFLDINMPGFTGFDFIQTLKNPPNIIITTSEKDFAMEAFEYNCIVDFLVKPIATPRFLKAVSKARSSTYPIHNSTTSSSKSEVLAKDLYVNIDSRLIKIDLSSINVIQAKGDYILIKTDDKNYSVHSTLKKIEEKLPDTLFLKVHRSYVINIKKIIDIEDNSVLIKREVIPVSRSKKPELMKRLNLL